MPRAIRHIVALALVAVGCLVAAGPVAAGPVAAADDRAPVLRGTVVDAGGRPFAVGDARMTLFAPDGAGVVAERFEVAADGSFEVELMPWGTAASPARLRIEIEGIVGAPTTAADGCTEQYAPTASTTLDVALAGGADPDPVRLVAADELVGRFCDGPGLPGTTLPPTLGDDLGAVGLAPIVGLLSSAVTIVLRAGRALPI